MKKACIGRVVGYVVPHKPLVKEACQRIEWGRITEVHALFAPDISYIGVNLHTGKKFVVLQDSLYALMPPSY